MSNFEKLQRTERDVFTVTRLNRTVRELVELTLGTVWVEGEISNLSRPGSGHLYFSLKDARAQVRCAFFKQRAKYCRVNLEHGQLVRVRARASVYEPRGDYQLIVESVEPAGDGALQQRYLENLKKLEAEGLFDAAKKRSLPQHPEHIGVVTSASGAAVRDVIEVLRRRYPLADVLVYPTPVQGQGAAERIAAAIELANDHAAVDVLLVVRGGGSLEDLWAFNEEVVVRAVAASRLPTVSGVGHEVDTTLTDLAADHRAPTPSAAAEMVSPPLDDLLRRLDQAERRLKRGLLEGRTASRTALVRAQHRLLRQHPQRQLETAAQRLDSATTRLKRSVTRACQTQRIQLDKRVARLTVQSPSRQIADRKRVAAVLQARLTHATQSRLQRANADLQLALRALNTVSPLATLERGYAVVRRDSSDEILRRADGIALGERLRITLRHGQVLADAVEPRDLD